MANSLNFKEDFDSLAEDGCIGAPHGEPAYGYLRVSSSGQADEGRSGLPRQLRNIHEAAFHHGCRIAWDMIFADDHTGFEFNDRPELSRLRKEYAGKGRRANIVVMEYLDRLSRNADWHQGYLLDEMKRYNITPIFWKSFNSRIERAVMGAISQDGMEQAKQRMSEGNLHKARDGRVTARVPAYGYMLVDSQGHPGEAAKKDSHYAIHPDEAPVVRYIFEKIASGEVTVRGLCMDLTGKYPPPKKMADWEPRLINIMIHNTVYKGEFVSHHMEEVKIPKLDPEGLSVGPTKYVTRRRERPKEEWIIVPVPPIVTPTLWEMANRALKMNKRSSRRNGKSQYLLTGLVKCAACKSSVIGGRKTRKKMTRQGEKTYISMHYRCPANSNRMPNSRSRLNCDQGSIQAKILEDAVWSAVYKVLLEPQILIDALDKDYYGEGNSSLKDQIAFLERSIEALDEDDASLWNAYRAKAFDADEYAARRNSLKENKAKLNARLAELRSQIMPVEVFEEKKRYILSTCQAAKASGLLENATYETKRRAIRLVVDRITLNVNEDWIKLEGNLRGVYFLGTKEAGEGGDDGGGNGKIVRSPKGRDSSRR